MWVIIWNSDRATYVSIMSVSIIQNESYELSPKKTKMVNEPLNEHERQYQYFSLLSSLTNAIGLYT